VKAERKIRVLVVDDSALVRKIVANSINGEDDMEVVGTAANGKIALEKLDLLRPDIVLLDLEMPEMDGITTLKRLRQQFRQLPVVVFSTLSERGAKITLDALSAGATDYLCKPSGMGGLSTVKELLHDVLAPKLRAQALKDARAMESRSLAPLESVPARRPSSNEALQLVCIGSSAGGPQALAEVIPKLPRALGVPVLVVQHMPPMFTKLLAERLAATAKLKVVEAEDGMSIDANTVYIARGGQHMRVAIKAGRLGLVLDSGALENGCRPAVDPLFRSAAALYGPRLLGIVMTGIGTDGTHGAREIQRMGGRVWAQDEASCAVWGMAGSVVKAGLAERIFTLSSLADELTLAVEGSRRSWRGSVRT
jgi:two-component system, chemotaxis family, protein-glutamate methylesterase/glutaminase